MISVTAKRQSRRIDRFHGSHRVTFDTRDLNQATDRIARQSKIVFHPDFRCVFDLRRCPAEHLRETPGGH